MLRRAAVVHVAAMPLGNAERIVAHARRAAPGALITVDTHESWDASRGRPGARAGRGGRPVRAEPGGTGRADGTAEPAAGAARAGRGRARPGGRRRPPRRARTCWTAAGSRMSRPPAPVVADSTGAGDTFCGGLAAGLAQGLSLVESAGLGAAVAAAAITASGSLRLLRPGLDRAAIAATGQQLAAAADGGPAGGRSPRAGRHRRGWPRYG